MNVTDFLKSNMPVLFDGANGTEYQRRGLAVGSPPELWNLTKPEVVKQIHREYIEAGSQVVTTNTFGGNRIRLRAGGIEYLRGEPNTFAGGWNRKRDPHNKPASSRDCAFGGGRESISCGFDRAIGRNNRAFRRNNPRASTPSVP